MYKNLKNIYDRERLDVFCMTTAHLLNIGFDCARDMTDEEVNNTNGNGIMTKDFCIYLNKLAREIAQSCDNNPVEIIQFCQAENVFDTVYYANKLNRKELESIASNAVNSMICDDFDPDDGNLAMQVADYIGCDQDELIMLGVFNEDDFEYDNGDEEGE